MDVSTEERIGWFICPVCDGDEGYAPPGVVEWVDCDCCDGQGGFAEITPTQRDEIIHSC